MNPNTGEIRSGEPGELAQNGFTLALTAAEAETLQEISPADRVKAIANWKDKEAGMRFNNNVERAKVKQAFLEGIVTGKLM